MSLWVLCVNLVLTGPGPCVPIYESTDVEDCMRHMDEWMARRTAWALRSGISPDELTAACDPSPSDSSGASS